MPMASLRNSRDFRRVYRRGRKARSDGVTVFATLSEGGGPRVGLAVPGRIGNAVARNRTKRRLRAALRTMDVAPDRDVVVRVDDRLDSTSFQELESHLAAALRSAGALR